MAIKTGVAAQFGIGDQTDYDTAATVDRFYEFNSETLKNDVAVIESRAMGRGRFLRSDRRKVFSRGGMGQVQIPVMNKGMGLILEHCIGQNTVTGGGAAKTHTIIPDAAALQGQAFTAQVGKPDVGGTVRPFTYQGCKVKSWELKADIGGELLLIVDLDSKAVTTGTALASASFPSTAEKFVFTEGVIALNGTTQFVKGFSLKGDNALATDRRGMGNVKREPLAAGLMRVTGTLNCEFDDLTRYAAFVAGTVLATLTLTFTLATVIPTTATPFSLTITIDDLVYTGDTPAVGGPEVVQNPTPFEAVYDGTNPTVKIEIVTSDTTS